MKKQLVLGLGLAVLASPAFATRARLQALGESTNGSYYIQDNRNIFLNSAEINNNKDLITYEWGGNNGQGGVIKSWNNMVYGLHLNNGTSMDQPNTDFITDVAPSAGPAALNPNTIDLFVGGDMGVKWGANLTYQNGNDEGFKVGSGATDTADAETKVMDLNVGVQTGDLKAFVNYGVNGEATYKKPGATAGFTNKATLDRDQDLVLGASYQLNDYTLFGQYATSEFTAKEDGAKTTFNDDAFQVGAGRQDKLNDKVTLFTKASYVNSKSEEKAATKDETKSWNVPVVIGLEAEATSWLAVRGSVSQQILSKNENKNAGVKTKSTNNNTTLVAVGASLKFGEFAIDGVVSNDTTNSAGDLNLDKVMSTVSMTYKF